MFNRPIEGKQPTKRRQKSRSRRINPEIKHLYLRIVDESVAYFIVSMFSEIHKQN